MGAAIEMTSVSKDFGSKSVLKDVSLSINHGEIFGLLGPSGAGKTTLLKILTGQIPPTNGKTYLFGTDSQNRNSEQRKFSKRSPTNHFPRREKIWGNRPG